MGAVWPYLLVQIGERPGFIARHIMSGRASIDAVYDVVFYGILRGAIAQI